MATDTWKPCGACKKPIPYGGDYWACSVSTCNRAHFQLAFCTLSCWDSHVAVLNHRNAWAVERRAPVAPAANAVPSVPAQTRAVPDQGRATDQGRADDQGRAAEPRRRFPRAPEPEPEAEDDVLIVASKLKKYIQDRSGLRTSAGVMGVLSDLVRRDADRAIEQARRHGRKTVMPEDFLG